MSRVQIELIGNHALGETRDLKSWLMRERLDGVHEVYQESKSPDSGEMGATALAALGIVLGAGATAELIKCIHKWIATRRRNLRIRIKTDGREVEIDCCCPESLSEMMRLFGEEG